MDEHNDGDPAAPGAAPGGGEPAEPSAPHPPPDAFGGGGGSGGPSGFVLPERLAFLRNRFILAGLGLLAVLLLTTLVLVALGGGDSEPEAGKAPTSEPTTEEDATVAVIGGGLPGKVRTTVILRNGPGGTYAILGTIPTGAAVSVVGRNDDGTWLQIIPTVSRIRGWVEADFVEVTGDVSELSVEGAGTSPSVSVPTQPRPRDGGTGVTPGAPTSTPRPPTATPQPTPRPPTPTTPPTVAPTATRQRPGTPTAPAPTVTP